MTTERPTSKDSSTDQPDLESQPEDLDPQARSLIVSGPIGIQGKGLPPSERKRIFDDLFFEDDRRGPYLLRFVVLIVLIVLSALIAALGLVNDSAAVVIGAMLIAPLATVGITAGVGERDLAFGAYRSARVKAEGWLAAAVLVTLLVVISIPLALNALDRYGLSEQNRVAADVIAEWDPALSIDRLVVNPTRDPMRVTIALSGEVGDKRPEVLATLLAERLGKRIDLALSFQPVYRGLSAADEPA